MALPQFVILGLVPRIQPALLWTLGTSPRVTQGWFESACNGGSVFRSSFRASEGRSSSHLVRVRVQTYREMR